MRGLVPGYPRLAIVALGKEVDGGASSGHDARLGVLQSAIGLFVGLGSPFGKRRERIVARFVRLVEQDAVAGDAIAQGISGFSFSRSRTSREITVWLLSETFENAAG
jgi:hypothetical protein